jgi:hypothetical protein
MVENKLKISEKNSERYALCVFTNFQADSKQNKFVFLDLHSVGYEG